MRTCSVAVSILVFCELPCLPWYVMLCWLPLLYTSGHIIKGSCGHLASHHRYLLGETWGKTLHWPASPSDTSTSLLSWWILTCFCVLSLGLANLMKKHWCFWMQAIKKGKQKNKFLLQECNSLVYQTSMAFLCPRHSTPFYAIQLLTWRTSTNCTLS